ncbi:MAG: phage antirepressor KilAC domain-containing protein [Nostoc sp.]|uniref:phage antirepressor KilAC domain-containing protein n=1 Tax=unclassified Nostoc TaxID=2593658 RepID=UPI001DE5FB1C|nr:phage antirepressor KilAC domain-containing protein [Nostoc sp. JL34]MBN3882560.1 phage antirepressor KilAC domain-containing protein [Nostoc sp. JL34]
MSNITIQTIDSTFVVDSRLIAAELGITHKSFKETIRTYKTDFEEFGNLAVHTEGVKGTSSYSEFLYLTEDHSYLSLTYSHNTPQVRRAKVNLVKAFRIARESTAPKMSLTLIESVEAYLNTLKEVEATKLLLAAADEKVKEMQPKVEEYNLLCEQGKDIKVGELSKILGVKNMGPIKLFKFLNAQKVLIEKSNLPYAEYIHCFNVVRKLNPHNGDVYNVPLVNTEGVSLIIKKLKAAGHIVTSMSKAA